MKIHNQIFLFGLWPILETLSSISAHHGPLITLWKKKKDAYTGILRDDVADSFIPIVCFAELINLSLLME